MGKGKAPGLSDPCSSALQPRGRLSAVSAAAPPQPRPTGGSPYLEHLLDGMHQLGAHAVPGQHGDLEGAVRLGVLRLQGEQRAVTAPAPGAVTHLHPLTCTPQDGGFQPRKHPRWLQFSVTKPDCSANPELPPEPLLPPRRPPKGCWHIPGFVLAQSLKALSRTSLRLIPEPPHRHPHISPAAPPFAGSYFYPLLFLILPLQAVIPCTELTPDLTTRCRPGSLRRRQELHLTASLGNAARTERATSHYRKGNAERQGKCTRQHYEVQAGGEERQNATASVK